MRPNAAQNIRGEMKMDAECVDSELLEGVDKISMNENKWITDYDGDYELRM